MRRTASRLRPESGDLVDQSPFLRLVDLCDCLFPMLQEAKHARLRGSDRDALDAAAATGRDHSAAIAALARDFAAFNASLDDVQT